MLQDVGYYSGCLRKRADGKPGVITRQNPATILVINAVATICVGRTHHHRLSSSGNCYGIDDNIDSNSVAGRRPLRNEPMDATRLSTDTAPAAPGRLIAGRRGRPTTTKARSHGRYRSINRHSSTIARPWNCGTRVHLHLFIDYLRPRLRPLTIHPSAKPHSS